MIFTNKHGLKNYQNCKLPKEIAREKLGHFMASNIFKNNSFGGPTYFDRRRATCLAVDKRAEQGWPSSRGKGWPAVCKSGPRLWKSTVFILFSSVLCKWGFRDIQPNSILVNK